MPRNRIQLGDTIKDMITGFEGVAIAETRWLNGCRRWAILSRELKDGVPLEMQWVDTDQCAFVKEADPTIAEMDKALSTVEPGGPQDDPKGPTR